MKKNMMMYLHLMKSIIMLKINAPHDELTLNDNDIPDEQKQSSLTGVYVRDEPYEMISDDDIDNISLPEIIKLHLPLKQYHSNEPQKSVHGQGESLNEIEIISDDDIEQYTSTRPFHSQQRQQHQSLTRNQRKNRKKRTRRYRFEVIRHIYHKFTITNIKRILIFMNIHYKNLNVVGNTLFLDVKDDQTKKEADEKLHDGLFTKEHYYRIRKKLNLGKNYKKHFPLFLFLLFMFVLIYQIILLKHILVFLLILVTISYRFLFLLYFMCADTQPFFQGCRLLQARPSQRSTLFHLSRSFRFLFSSLCSLFLLSSDMLSFLSSSYFIPFGVISIRSFSFIPLCPRVYAPDISRSHTFISLLFHC